VNDFYRGKPGRKPLKIIPRGPGLWEWTPRRYEARIAFTCQYDPDLISYVWEKLWLWNWPKIATGWYRTSPTGSVFAIPGAGMFRRWCGEYFKRRSPQIRTVSMNIPMGTNKVSNDDTASIFVHRLLKEKDGHFERHAYFHDEHEERPYDAGRLYRRS